MVRNTLSVVSFALFELLVTFSEAVAKFPLGGGGGGGSGGRVAILVALITAVGAVVAALLSRSNSQK
jgi:hypothetical protein